MLCCRSTGEATTRPPRGGRERSGLSVGTVEKRARARASGLPTTRLSVTRYIRSVPRYCRTTAALARGPVSVPVSVCFSYTRARARAYHRSVSVGCAAQPFPFVKHHEAGGYDNFILRKLTHRSRDTRSCIMHLVRLITYRRVRLWIGNCVS